MIFINSSNEINIKFSQTIRNILKNLYSIIKRIINFILKLLKFNNNEKNRSIGRKNNSPPHLNLERNFQNNLNYPLDLFSALIEEEMSIEKLYKELNSLYKELSSFFGSIINGENEIKRIAKSTTMNIDVSSKEFISRSHRICSSFFFHGHSFNYIEYIYKRFYYEDKIKNNSLTLSSIIRNKKHLISQSKIFLYVTNLIDPLDEIITLNSQDKPSFEDLYSSFNNLKEELEKIFPLNPCFNGKPHEWIYDNLNREFVSHLFAALRLSESATYKIKHLIELIEKENKEINSTETKKEAIEEVNNFFLTLIRRRLIFFSFLRDTIRETKKDLDYFKEEKKKLES